MSTIITRSGKGSPLTTAEVDANFTNLNTDKAEVNNPTFTGTVTIPAGASISGYAPLASPTFTGAPVAPTAALNDSTTKIATTAWFANQASAVTPNMDGVASIGTAIRFARSDHVHPTDTSRAPVASPTFTGTVTIPAGASISGYAPLASPTFTGTPAAPTAAADTNTAQVATTAYFVGQASSTNPIMSGVAAIGTSLRFARADHVHPSDTSRAPLNAPSFTGGITVAGRAFTTSVSVSFGATVTINADNSNVFVVGTLTGNVTTLTMNGSNDGQTVSIRFIQDVTGGRTVANPVGSRIVGSVNTAAQSTSWLVLTYTATSGRWEGTWTQLP